MGRAGDKSSCVLVSDKEAAELEELLQLFQLGLGESDQFAAALQVSSTDARWLRLAQSWSVSCGAL